ncbi:MAG: PAS domain S-box protein [Verrucomicrobiales bacterium]|nr:PAS domain S-box protein [Verrucomicrobiales bacterium]
MRKGGPTRRRGISRQFGRLLVVGWLMLCPGLCLAERPYEPVVTDAMREPWRWRTFPQLNGLNSQSLGESADGTLWFGTGDGVWTYDGMEWRHIPPSVFGKGAVVSICCRPEGRVYLATVRNLVWHDGGGWTNLLSPAASAAVGGIRKLVVSADGSLWAATARGALFSHHDRAVLYTCRPQSVLTNNVPAKDLTTVTLPARLAESLVSTATPQGADEFSDVVLDSAGRLWFVTPTGRLLVAESNLGEGGADAASAGSAVRWTVHTEANGLRIGGRASILPLSDGRVWVWQTASGGSLNIYDGASWTAVSLSELGLKGECANPIQTKDGTVWVSGRYVVHAFRNGRWTTYQRPEAPIPSAQNLLHQSADGALWIVGPGMEMRRVEYQTLSWIGLQGLNFHWESAEGTQWFLSREGRVVRHDRSGWTSFGIEDGAIDAPLALLGTRRGTVWIAGSHGGVAAAARYEGGRWERFLHPNFSWSIDGRALAETADGSVWMGAAVDSGGLVEHRAGLLQFRDGTWIHHHQPGRGYAGETDEDPTTLLPATVRPEPIGKFYSIGESADGRVWAGRNCVAYHDGQRWTRFVPPQDFSLGVVEILFSSSRRDLWVGTRQFGALRYDGREWRRFQGGTNLVANSIRGFAETPDGSIWAATDRGFSRYDGRTWSDVLFPDELAVPHDGGGIRATPSGGVWINRVAPDWNRRAWSKSPPLDLERTEFWTVCRRFEGPAPETRILNGPREVSADGNLSVFWDATVPWCEPRESTLTYSYQLDGQGWSVFSPVNGRVFPGLGVGGHRLEVRARDHGLLVDPTPAVLDFVVLPPVWRQGWFVSLMVLLGGAVATQSLRVFRERDRLRRANQDLAEEMRNRELAQAAVRERDEQYRKLVAASPDAILTIDVSGRVTLASVRAVQLLGIASDASVEGRCVFDWVASEDKERARALLGQVLNRGALPRQEFVLVRDDGTSFDAEVSAAPIESSEGTVRGLVLIARDVSERRRAAEWLRKLSRAVEQSPSSILITDPQGRIEYVNRKFVAVTGYTEPEVLGKYPSLLKSGETPRDVYREMWQTITGGKEWLGELCNRKKSGELFWELASVCPILDAEGRISHFLAIKEDITERRRLEGEFRQAQKLEAVGRLAGGVAHDFNNILTAILMSLSLVKGDDRLAPETIEELDEMERGANRAASLTRQLLVFSRRHLLDRKPIDLSEVVGNMIKMLRRLLGEDVELEVRGYGAPLWVMADAGMMDQVLMNLCVNARDAMPEGGTIVIAGRTVTFDAEQARQNRDARAGEFICLSVTDFGCGMDSTTREHVFEPFFTTKGVGKGTGLGLATVYSIVNQHHGWIEIVSAPGKGSTFKVFLPALNWQEAKPAQVVPSNHTGGSETILLVEDDPGLRRLAVLTLRRRGYKVQEAASGIEALDIWERCRGQIDLLFTDMVMPGGMSGLDLAERLLREDRHIRVLATSGYSPERAKLDVLSARGIGYLPKPYGDGALVQAVQQVMSRPTPTSSSGEDSGGREKLED